MMELSNEEAAAVSILNNLISGANNSLHLDGSDDESDDTDDAEITDDESEKSVNSTEIEDLVSKTINKINSVSSRDVKIFLQPTLQKIISSTCSKPITQSTMKCLLRDNFDVKNISTKEERDLLLKAEAVLKAGLVYFLSLKSLNIHDEIDTVDEFLAVYSQYPLFSKPSIDQLEGKFLLSFRNMMKKALQVIPAKRNKHLLVTICSLLEGSGRLYVTGGTQSVATSRRLQIYEHESGEQKRRRPERMRTAPKKPASKQMVTCDCGAVILKRTIWKHNQSKKHLEFISREKRSLPQRPSTFDASSIHCSIPLSLQSSFASTFPHGFMPHQPMQLFFVGSQPWSCVPINSFSQRFF